MAAFAFKALTLSLKTLAKPLAERFKVYVLAHPTLRGRVIDLAQKLHRLDVGVSRGAEGSSGRAFVGELTEDKAVELAGKVVSEGFVYTVAIGLLGLEVARQTRNDGIKKEREAAYQQMLEERYREEQKALQSQKVLLDEVVSRLEKVEQTLARFSAATDLAHQHQRRFWGVFGLGG
eukprot:jgi/Botrbrau1/18286/Bobra.0179s0017.1